ncbi:MAG: Tyrosine recombinase XerC [Alphaproteobacteria bacterium MarineAlpha6_Bin1]|nr:MAG: Tyrosine recombinase XerC [Alphaproteobacteria bacterium MarineAlpha6_Bin1]
MNIDDFNLDINKLNKELIDGVEDYIDNSKSDNTRKAYENDWRDFVKFCRYTKAKFLPADYPTVAKYLVYCAKLQKLKVSTIERRLASIIFKHREFLHSIDRKHKLIKNVIEGIKRNFGSKPDSSKALSLDNIKAIINKIDENESKEKDKNSNLARNYRDKTLILIGFLGGFRRSELININYEDVERDLDGLRITVRKSKTDQRGSGIHKKGIRKSSVGPKYCPVVNYENWIKISGISSGKIFRQIDRSNKILDKLSDKAVALIIKWKAEKAGIDSAKLAGHSMRSGIATVLAKEGATENEIKKITGHRSSQMVQRYIQDAELFDNATKTLDL